MNWKYYGPHIIASLIAVLLFVMLVQAIKEQENKKQFQQKLNFLCSPGVYVETISNHDSKFAICLMKPDSKEFIVKEILE